MTSSAASHSTKASSFNYEPLPGFMGNLNEKQEYDLKQLYLAMFIASGAAPNTVKIGMAAPPVDHQHHHKGGLFGRRAAPAVPETSTTEEVIAELKQTQASHLHELLPRFRESCRSDSPDGMLLRFLRARKWDVKKAAEQFGRTLKFRMDDYTVDLLLERNEPYYTFVKPDPDYINQFKLDKVVLHGHDKQGRPLVFINVKNHDPKAQSEEAMERFTLQLIENARLCMNKEVSTSAVVFDLGGFGLSNMDYNLVKFILACFEQYYPECLGYLFIHRAPWVFSGVWSVIKGWIDPVVASKISFTKNEKDLLKFIDSDQIPKSLGGTSPFQLKYIPPTETESRLVQDLEGRKVRIAERVKLFEQLDQLTLQWIQAPSKAESDRINRERQHKIGELYQQYWTLDPYIRARALEDRNGTFAEFKPELAPGGIAQPTL